MSDAPADPSEPEPPSREFQFKPTEFERANRPLGEADDTSAIDLRDLYQQATQPLRPRDGPPPEPVKNDVHAILQANLDRANAAGANEVELRPKPMSRRNRDYWLMLALGNLMFTGLMFIFFSGVIALTATGAGCILFTLGLTWIMRFIMDDY